MKHKHGKTAPSRMTLAEADRLAAKDKRKLIIMSIGLVVLIGAFVVSQLTAKRKQDEANEQRKANLGAVTAEGEVDVYLPEFNSPETLETINDATESGRVVLSEPAILAALKHARQLRPAHLEALGIRTITPEFIEAVSANPKDYRLKPTRVRGKILQIRTRPETEESPSTYYGTMQSDTGEVAHFVASDTGKDEELPTEYLLLDGLFVQMHKVEVDKEWIDAPLIVGKRLLPSYPRLVLDEDLNTPALATVEDDGIKDNGATYTTGVPQAAKWELMAKALQDKGQIDWDNAPMISDEYIARMIEGDDSLRGKPFKFSIRTNQDARTVASAENPLYRDQFMEGWFGDYTSKQANGLIRWVGAFDNPDLHDMEGKAKFVTGRGFFLKAWVYKTRSKTAASAIVPYFVMQSVDVHERNPDKSHTGFLWIMVGITGFMLLLITWLLSRDKRQNEALQRRLVERRRARRAQQTAQQTAQSS